MAPLEEALGIARQCPGRVQFVAVPRWGDFSGDWLEDWLRRIEAFYNLGSRIVKFHLAPQTLLRTGLTMDSPRLRRVMEEAVARGMVLMSHVGDPELWYQTRYADAAKFGTRAEHYRGWEGLLDEFCHGPWLGAHLGGYPENLPYLQELLDRFPNLSLDLSATRWVVREISQRREAAREFVLRNQDRLVWGSDQVSGDDRGFDFLASRWWCHRKLWETAWIGPSPIFDPDLPEEAQPRIQGLALPAEVLQKLYHDNIAALLAKVGVRFE
jgi:hypothetical protein